MIENSAQAVRLMSLEKFRLTDYVGELASDKLRELDRALHIAFGLPTSARAPA